MTENLTIESMAYQGAGVAHAQDGKAVFVEGAVVGDVIMPLTLQSQSSYDKCVSFELLEPSPKRMEVRCPHANLCDGCPWQILAYDEQLQWKQRFVIDAYERIGKIPNSKELVKACVPSPLQWYYRNKVELNAFIQEGKLGLGLRKKASHEHVRIDQCLLMQKSLKDLPKKIAGALNYSLKDAQNDLVRVAVRSSANTGATELALFMVPSGVNRSLLAKTLSQNAQLSSIVRAITEGEVAARKVKQVEVLSGAGHWKEELAHNTYKISAPSFFQINSAIAELMVAHLEGLLDKLGIDSSASVADLYSGAGTFTLPLARRFEHVIAIESYGSSIRDLRRNLEEAGLDAEVIGGDVARELPQLEPVELAIIDPPRSGLRPEAVEALLNYQAPYLVYVSCNPATMARDIGLLTRDTYQLVNATPFDQFPQSYHVEIMAVLKRR